MTFKEAGLNSEFTLPPGWTYKKVTDGVLPSNLMGAGEPMNEKLDEDLDQFLFYDQNQKQVGGVSFFGPHSNSEASFDGCSRGWGITSGELMSSKASGTSTWATVEPSTWVMERYTYVTNDPFTSVITESCAGMASIYWVPGDLISDQDFLSTYYALEGKKPFVLMALAMEGMSEEENRQLVHSIVKSIKIQK